MNYVLSTQCLTSSPQKQILCKSKYIRFINLLPRTNLFISLSQLKVNYRVELILQIFLQWRLHLGKLVCFVWQTFPMYNSMKHKTGVKIKLCSWLPFWLQLWSAAKVTGQQPVAWTQLSVWFCKWSCNEADLPICLHTLGATFTQ